MGNTPTCVGKTNLHFYEWAFDKKHPHVRGEDSASGPKDGCRIETPPRAWGRRRKGMALNPAYGNTPTCVGKTLFRS